MLILAFLPPFSSPPSLLSFLQFKVTIHFYLSLTLEETKLEFLSLAFLGWSNICEYGKSGSRAEHLTVLFSVGSFPTLLKNIRLV
jgi:hypothetical protein